MLQEIFYFLLLLFMWIGINVCTAILVRWLEARWFEKGRDDSPDFPDTEGREG